MMIYISGPMTGLPDYNRAAFYRAETELQIDGAVITNPARLGLEVATRIASPTWRDYLEHDIRHLVDCDALVLLDGWEHSKGACLERHIAEELGMMIFDSIEAARLAIAREVEK